MAITVTVTFRGTATTRSLHGWLGPLKASEVASEMLAYSLQNRPCYMTYYVTCCMTCYVTIT